MTRGCAPAVALALLAATPAHAQRAAENVVTAAEDAFGTSVGRETIGLYSSGNVRGFSPTAAGNARIDGLYFDQVWGLTHLAAAARDDHPRRPVHVRLPVPRAHRRHRLSVPPPRRGAGAGHLRVRRQLGRGGARSRRRAAAQGRAAEPWAGARPLPQRLYNATDSLQHVEGAALRWRPSDGVEVMPFWSRSDIYDDEIGPIYVPAGPYLPPRIKRRRFRGPEWAIYEGVATNYGLLASYAASANWLVRAGAFRSFFDNDVDHFNFLVDLTPDGTARQIIDVDPPAKFASTSGELRLTRSLTEGPRLHVVHVSLRGRERTRRYGGTDTVDLGPIRIEEEQEAAQPAYDFTEQDQDRVRQWIGSIAYEGRWRDRGEFSLAIQRTDYEKRIARAGLPVTVSKADPWLWNASLTVNITRQLALYGGYTRGLEESGVAPGVAVNRNEALPAIETSQRDAGLRWALRPELRLIAGVFDVEKPYFSLDEAGVWRELGDVRNRGIELSLAGTLTPRLDVVAGAILLDADVTGEGVRLGRVGRRPVDSTGTTLRLNADWRPPGLEGISFDVGVLHTGDVIATRDNLVEIPARTIVDLRRYRFTLGDNPATLRVQLTNVGDVYGFDLRGSGAYDAIPGRLATLSLAVDL